MYRIKISYKTGNSFGSEDKEDFLDYTWTNIEMAKKSLERIKNHYEFYMEQSNVYEKPEGKLPEGVVWDTKYRAINLELLDDNGKPYPIYPFWIGYFEKLYSAEIIIGLKGLKYTIN